MSKSELQFLVDEHGKYDGCVPVTLGNLNGTMRMFAPPWDIGQYCYPDIITDCVRTQAGSLPGVRIDDQGNYYLHERGGNHVGKLKTIQTWARPVPTIITDLNTGGYQIPDNYWLQHRSEIKDTVNF